MFPLKVLLFLVLKGLVGFYQGNMLAWGRTFDRNIQPKIHKAKPFSSEAKLLDTLSGIITQGLVTV